MTPDLHFETSTKKEVFLPGIGRRIPRVKKKPVAVDIRDYLPVLWENRLFVAWTAFLPTILFALLAILVLPQQYIMTYTYRRIGISYASHQMFLDRFYSLENMNRLIARLRQEGLNKYATKAEKGFARPGGRLKSMLSFEPWPPLPQIYQTTDLAEVEKAGGASAQFLYMMVKSTSVRDIDKLASVIRENVENIMPLYELRQGLQDDSARFRSQIADIQRAGFGMEVSLESSKAIWAKLRQMKPQAVEDIEEKIFMQFDMGAKSEYLPLVYQVRAIETKIAGLEEDMKVREKNLAYYSKLLELTTKFHHHLETEMMPDYSILQFRDYLISFVSTVDVQELRDYLDSYIMQVENIIPRDRPLVELPGVKALPKGTVRKTMIVFVIAFTLSVFAAFLKARFKDIPESYLSWRKQGMDGPFSVPQL